MSIDLSPQAESLLRLESERKGISIDDLIFRTFGDSESGFLTKSDNYAERLFAVLRERQRDYGLPVPSGGYQRLSELFEEWNSIDAQMSDEERDAERRFWEDYERGRDERPLRI